VARLLETACVLLAVSALRESGIAARLRVGFASYLRPGHWEDQWVCEHKASGQWAIFDAELNSRVRTARGITFDGSNIPKSHWQSAAAIWNGIDASEIDPAICGISFANLSGKWLVARSMLQDAAALAGIETLPWDNWGAALRFGATRQLTEEQMRDFDALAVALNPPPSWVNRYSSLASEPDGRSALVLKANSPYTIASTIRAARSCDASGESIGFPDLRGLMQSPTRPPPAWTIRQATREPSQGPPATRPRYP
jgi:hypothetical protein